MRTQFVFLAGALAGVLAATPAAAEAKPPTSEPGVLTDSMETYRDARQSGGPGKDGIPSIDEPSFQSAEAAAQTLDDGDIVIGVYRNGEARAYPQKILVWHEIVNDEIGGDSLAVTYCPLTGTALGFERGDTELGVSGKLLNSNLVMYDRATDTEYPQILGAGIEGPLAGEGLVETRIFWTEWGNWRERHPDTRVLTSDTGYMRDYQRDPYGQYNPRSGYYAEESPPMFPVLHEDDRYPAKHMMLGFRDGDQAVAVDKGALSEAGILRHSGPGGEYLIVHDPGLDTGWVFRGAGEIDVAPDDIQFTPEGPEFAGSETLTRVNAFEAMWFAWAGFYPQTEVIDG